VTWQEAKKEEINIGLVGTGVMAKAHSIAYSIIPIFFPFPLRINKMIVADATKELAQSGAHRLGFEKWTDRWEELVKMDEVDVVDIVTPNYLHMPIAVAAAENKKHVICEKPLALNLEQSRKMYQAVKRAGIKHCVAFNYRMTPAVLEAKRMIEQGQIGEIYHFRGVYLQDWAIDANSPLVWRFRAARAGSGSLGDIASHTIDYARYLVGESSEVVAISKTFVKERPLDGIEDKVTKPARKGKVDVDDAVSFLIKFKNGAIGSIEASRFCYGRKNHLAFEISGSEGALHFNWERRNELLFYSAESPANQQGFTTILTGPAHPYGGVLWPIPGLGMSYIETTVFLLQEFLKSIVKDQFIEPNFYDGLRVSKIMNAVLKSAAEQRWIKC